MTYDVTPIVSVAIKSLNFQKKKKKKKKPAKRFSATLNWSLSCRHASWDVPGGRDFLQGFYRKEVPAVQGLYLGFANGKVNIPAISRPQGGRGCKWLVHNKNTKIKISASLKHKKQSGMNFNVHGLQQSTKQHKCQQVTDDTDIPKCCEWRKNKNLGHMRHWRRKIVK